MPETGSRSILIIDDDPISREVMGLTLEMHGYSVTGVEDGNAAIASLDESRNNIPTKPDSILPDLVLPDLVLMDAQMPGLSGVELITALRAAGASRIVAISASEPGGAIRDAADGFLLKPVQPEAVAELFSKPVPLSVPATKRETAPQPASSTTARNPVAGPAIDPEILGKFRAMMPAASVREIYEATAADMKMRLGTLDDAINASNPKEVSRIAHSIKGSCAMVGLTAGRDAAARLEISNLPVTWPAELAQMRIALEALEVMLANDFSS